MPSVPPPHAARLSVATFNSRFISVLLPRGGSGCPSRRIPESAGPESDPGEGKLLIGVGGQFVNGLVRPMGEGLVMEQLKYQEELRPFDEVPLETVDVADGELELAVQIIEQRANTAFEPEKYRNDVRAHMQEVIQHKVDGQEVSVAPEERAEAKIIDLMEALKASVTGAGENGAEEDDGPPRPAKRAPARGGTADGGTKTRKRSKARKA